MAYLIPTGARITNADTPVALIPSTWFDAHPDMKGVNSVILQNLGSDDIYILSDNQVPNITTYENVMLVIPSGENFVDASQLFNDVDVQGVYTAPKVNSDPLLVTVKVN